MFSPRAVRVKDVVLIGVSRLVDGEIEGGRVDMEPRSWHQPAEPETRVGNGTEFGMFLKMSRTPKDTVLKGNLVINRFSLFVDGVVGWISIALAFVDNVEFGFIFGSATGAQVRARVPPFRWPQARCGHSVKNSSFFMSLFILQVVEVLGRVFHINSLFHAEPMPVVGGFFPEARSDDGSEKLEEIFYGASRGRREGSIFNRKIKTYQILFVVLSYPVVRS